MKGGRWHGVVLGGLLLWALTACAALSDDMRRAETAFDQARYEDVEVWLHALEPDVPDMNRSLRARFYYLRGTTAYRLEDKATARHYLALAKQEAAKDASALRKRWREDLGRMLDELAHPQLEREVDAVEDVDVSGFAR